VVLIEVAFRQGGEHIDMAAINGANSILEIWPALEVVMD
jgi:hypothetical protein